MPSLLMLSSSERTDDLHAAASNRPCLDDLTFQSRGILNQVERWRHLADRLAVLDGGAENATTMAQPSLREAYSWRNQFLRPTSLDEGQTRSVPKSSLLPRVIKQRRLICLKIIERSYNQ
jgi:hypothetical protein